MIKIMCASDFHIGSETTNYPKIKSFLNLVKKEQPDKLILCGDIYDLWRQTPEVIITQEPYKSTHNSLLDLAETIPIYIIWGNHDFNLSKKLDLANIKITDDFVEDNIYFTHGWRFDVNQRFASKFYSWLVNYFPYLYQRFFKKPSEIIEIEKNIINMNIYNEVRKFMNKNNYKKLIMGHTHNPIIINNKIFDCGDFVDSCSYIVIDGDNDPLLKWL